MMKKFPAGNYASVIDKNGFLYIPESISPGFDGNNFLMLKNQTNGYKFLSLCFLPYLNGVPGKTRLKKIPISEELRHYAELSKDASMVSYSSYSGLIEIWNPVTLKKYTKHIKPQISRYIREQANY